jgi:hypothetical protein
MTTQNSRSLMIDPALYGQYSFGEKRQGSLKRPDAQMMITKGKGGPTISSALGRFSTAPWQERRARTSRSMQVCKRPGPAHSVINQFREARRGPQSANALRPFLRSASSVHCRLRALVNAAWQE